MVAPLPASGTPMRGPGTLYPFHVNLYRWQCSAMARAQAPRGGRRQRDANVPWSQGIPLRSDSKIPYNPAATLTSVHITTATLDGPLR